jgi:hypothetical protein
MINKVNPAFISPCYATLKRDIGCGYKIAIELMKDHIKKTCTYASITADLWTSRAKTGYIGITCHWLTQEMKLYDILVCVEQISYPHTGEHIRNTIQSKLKVLGLEEKINIAITDNGGNMLKAIREWDGVNCVACSAHTLQLCVLKGLKEIKPYLNKYVKLNQFFESPKQMERLEVAQREIFIRQVGIYNPLSSPTESDNQNEEENIYKPLKILRTVTEVPTRWGSKLASWKRLKELKEPIKRLYAVLALEVDREAKKDYQRLTNLMLNDNEWNLLDKLIELLIPIERATEFLGGQKYCTLSLIFPTIQTLKFEYTPDPNIAMPERNNNGKFNYFFNNYFNINYNYN